jgi:integrase
LDNEVPRPRKSYVQKERNRHGKTVWYFRRGDGPRVRLPDPYESPAFNAAYIKALAGGTVDEETPTISKSVKWTIERYRQSSVFTKLAMSTRRVRERILLQIIAAAGDKPITAVNRASIVASRDKRADRPEAANAYVKTIRAVLDFAVSIELIPTNPARDVKLIRNKTDGFHTWTIDEVALFEARHPVGTKARLALDIFLFTGLRRSDAVVLGKQHIRDGILSVRTKKTGKEVSLRLLPPLRQSIAATPTGDLTFIVTEFGKAFTSNGFGNWFRKRCEEAGVPGSAHGLRKAAAVRAAENGATTEDLKAMFGWETSKQPDVYTKAANRAKIGIAASGKLEKQDENIYPRTNSTVRGLSSNDE